MIDISKTLAETNQTIAAMRDAKQEVSPEIVELQEILQRLFTAENVLKQHRDLAERYAAGWNP